MIRWLDDTFDVLWIAAAVLFIFGFFCGLLVCDILYH